MRTQFLQADLQPCPTTLYRKVILSECTPSELQALARLTIVGSGEAMSSHMNAALNDVAEHGALRSVLAERDNGFQRWLCGWTLLEQLRVPTAVPIVSINVFVHPSMRRRSLGSSLLVHSRELIAQHWGEADVRVYAWDDRSVAFYAAVREMKARVYPVTQEVAHATRMATEVERSIGEPPDW